MSDDNNQYLDPSYYKHPEQPPKLDLGYCEGCRKLEDIDLKDFGYSIENFRRIMCQGCPLMKRNRNEIRSS